MTTPTFKPGDRVEFTIDGEHQTGVVSDISTVMVMSDDGLCVSLMNANKLRLAPEDGRITCVDDIRGGATYEIGGVKFTGRVPNAVVKSEGLYGPKGTWFSGQSVVELLAAGVPITEVSPPPVPEHVEPKYVKYGVYADADMPMGGEWMYLPDDSHRGYRSYPWMAMLSTSLKPWRTRDELPDNLRLIRSSTPVEDQS